MRGLMRMVSLLAGGLAFFAMMTGCGRPRVPVRLQPPAWIQGTWASEIGGQQLVFTEQDMVFQTPERSYRVSETFSSVSDSAAVVDYYTITGVPAFPLSLIRSGTVTLTFRRVEANVMEVQNPFGPSGRFIRQGTSPAFLGQSLAEVRI